jgi:hypothetical protein
VRENQENTRGECINLLLGVGLEVVAQGRKSVREQSGRGGNE